MTLTIHKSMTLNSVVCPACGIMFAVPDSFLDAQIRNAGGMHCPNGHQFGWHETEADRLRKRMAAELAKKDQELAREKERMERAQAEVNRQRERAERNERRVSAQKGLNTKLRNKIAAGTCPCCEMLFPDLAGHMATEHPTFEAEPEDAEVV